MNWCSAAGLLGLVYCGIVVSVGTSAWPLFLTAAAFVFCIPIFGTAQLYRTAAGIWCLMLLYAPPYIGLYLVAIYISLFPGAVTPLDVVDLMGMTAVFALTVRIVFSTYKYNRHLTRAEAKQNRQLEKEAMRRG